MKAKDGQREVVIVSFESDQRNTTMIGGAQT
jgi:hypothetical protein